MKAIFKKNQIIITALAIMIAVVGYLNFAKDAEKEEENEAKLTAGNSYTDSEDYGDLSAEDLGEDTYFTYQMSDNGEMVLKENRVAAEKTRKEYAEKKTCADWLKESLEKYCGYEWEKVRKTQLIDILKKIMNEDNGNG